MRLPHSFKTAVAATAKSLNHSLKLIGALHEDAGLLLSERNALTHLGAHLLHAGFALAAEPRAGAKTQTPGLVASNHKISLAITAHTFGKLRLEKILAEAQALRHYAPRAYPRLDLPTADAFWQDSEHWAALFIQSFAGEKFNELWRGQIAAAEAFEKNLRAFSQLGNAGKEDFSELASFLREHQAHVGMEPICPAIAGWHAGERLDLLWAAFPLER